MIGIVYFFVIIIANSIGAVSGMGGGVIIKPIFDFIGADSVTSITFYSAIAVLTMSIVSTFRQFKSGIELELKIIGWLSAGAVVGGIIGNATFEYLLGLFVDEKDLQFLQIVLTVLTLLFAYFYSKFNWKNFSFKNYIIYLLCGLFLGFLASLLGIGGGPINVSFLMLLFAMPIKKATVYSIAIIFFSQLSKIVTIAIAVGFERYNLTMLFFIIPAAILGGLVGAKLSNLFSQKVVTVVFQSVILLVLVINIVNGFQLL